VKLLMLSLPLVEAVVFQGNNKMLGEIKRED
jgi:hypothetical protein